MLLASALRPLVGSDFVRHRLLAPQICRSDRVGSAVEVLDRTVQPDRAMASGAEEAPVFVLSAGWGSGSTLVQRLIISGGETLVWGEPMDEAGPIERMAETVAAVRDGWPPDAHFLEDHSVETLSRAWIANLAPPIERYRDGHRAFLRGWLGNPAVDAGYAGWGLKEVRLTIDHARYLRWLFPNARFVFVYRDLYSSYLSCRRKPWLSIWPTFKATPLLPFAHHWRYLLRGFLEGHAEVGGLLIRYEDFLENGEEQLSRLQDYLGLASLDASLMEKKVGGRSARRHPLILPEKVLLDSVAGDLRRALGYTA